MGSEIQALEENNTWTLSPLPASKKPIGCKWVYKFKYKSNKSIECYKACLVTKGHTQIKGTDYNETFSLVPKLVTIHCLLELLQPKDGLFIKWMFKMRFFMMTLMKKSTCFHLQATANKGRT